MDGRLPLLKIARLVLSSAADSLARWNSFGMRLSKDYGRKSNGRRGSEYAREDRRISASLYTLGAYSPQGNQSAEGAQIMAELTNQVVSRQEWSDARNRLLIKEKEYTRLGDQLSEERRRLPWKRVEKE